MNNSKLYAQKLDLDLSFETLSKPFDELNLSIKENPDSIGLAEYLLVKEDFISSLSAIESKYKLTFRGVLLKEFLKNKIHFNYNSLNYLDSLFKVANQKKDTSSIIQLLYVKGLMSYNLGKINVAYTNFLDGLVLSNKISSCKYQMIFRFHLASLDLQNDQLDKAENNLFKALKLSYDCNNQLVQMYINDALISYYIKRDVVDSALNYINKNQAFLEKIELPSLLARLFYFKSIISVKKNDLNKSLSNLRISDQYCKKYKLAYQFTVNYNQRALVQEVKGGYDLAIESANNSLMMADFRSQLKEVKLSYLILSRNHARLGNYRRAYESLDAYKIFNDSLNSKKTKEKLNELQVKYESEKQKQELIKRENEIKLITQEAKFKTERQNYIIIILVIIVILITLIYLYLFVRSKKRYQEDISKKLIGLIDEERDRIARDLHDDLGQDLTIFKNRWLLLKTKNKPFDVDEGIDGLINKSRKLAKELSPTLIDKVGLVKALSIYFRDIKEQLGVFTTKSINDEHFFENNFDLEQKTHVFRIVQECINNTIKHSGADSLKLTLEVIEDKWSLIYQDNGRGIVKKDSYEGFGFNSMRERAKLLNGEMDIDYNNKKGVKLVFTFKNR